MLEKIKHNKIKNTGIIYLILVRKMIEETINNQKPTAYNIFNNFFSKNKALGQELAIYNLLTTTRYLSLKKADTLFYLTLNLRMKIDLVKLEKLKYFCIRLLKKHYDLKELFNSKVLNYKVYASIYKVFLSLKLNQYNPLNIVLSKYQILLFMLKPMRLQVIDEDMELFKAQTKLVKDKALELFVLKFNLKYKALNLKQKELLKKYTYSMSNTNSINLYMDALLDSIKSSLQEHKSTKLQTILLSIDKIKAMKIVLDKIYSLLNLYLILKLIKK